ncbi:MAG TPA: ABC transporter ATP-binding protein [Geopsychrobacteraceae bacterium]|nr:ABC transporter ATP-binding protein [Geopsychrobacteraceae bacterium]
MDNRNLYYRLVRYAAPYKGRIFLSVLASVGVAGSDAVVAKLVEPFIDKIIVKGDFDLAKLVPFFVIALAAFKGFSRYVQGYFINTAGQLAIQDIRNNMFEHSVRLSMSFYVKHSSGTLMSRILNDVNLVQSTLSNVLVTLVRDSLTLLALVGVAFYTDWKMSLMAFIVVPLTALPASTIGKRIKRVSKRGQGAMGELTSVLEQTFSGIKVIKSFATEKKEIANFKDQNFSYYRFIRKTLKYEALSSPVVELLSSFGAAGALWFGLERVMSGEMTQGQLFSVLTAITLMYAPLKRLVKVNNVIQRALGAAERMFEIIDEKPEIVEIPNAVELTRSKGAVSFEHVNFSYDNEPVLQDFTATINAGEVVALVGPSGAGKTTFIALLNRFYDPGDGIIRIDGHDIRTLTQKSLHDNLALVDQETFLFNDTILGNISYGCPEASDEEVIEASKKAYADEFIRCLPEGYDTMIGDRGVRLSGGQRQRLCIARALLRDAPILLLDEATSALDTESEAKVQRALGNLMRDRTTIVIAHRLSTVVHADKILVLQDGRVCQSGTHQQLQEQDGLYKRLYDIQFRE